MISKISTALVGWYNYIATSGKLAWPNIILGNRGSLGDAILMTTLVCELHRRKQHTAILTDTPELYAGLPFSVGCIPKDTPILNVAKICGTKVHYIEYAKAIPGDHAEYSPQQHILAEMCANARLSGEIVLRPYFALTDEEKSNSIGFKGVIAIQSSCMNARFKMWTKEWGSDRMARVVKELKKTRRVVQLGSLSDPILEGAEDRRGLPFRQVAGILWQADIFVGLVGFLMHLTRAVETPAVIVYGGRERPWQSGYQGNINLTADTPCSPCWRYDDCPGKRVCMDMIKVTDVVSAAQELLDKPKRCLPEQKTLLKPCSF